MTSYTTFAFVKNVCFKSLPAFKKENSKMLFLDPRISTKRIFLPVSNFLQLFTFMTKVTLKEPIFYKVSKDIE